MLMYVRLRDLSKLALIRWRLWQLRKNSEQMWVIPLYCFILHCALYSWHELQSKQWVRNRSYRFIKNVFVSLRNLLVDVFAVVRVTLMKLCLAVSCLLGFTNYPTQVINLDNYPCIMEWSYDWINQGHIICFTSLIFFQCWHEIIIAQTVLFIQLPLFIDWHVGFG